MYVLLPLLAILCGVAAVSSRSNTRARDAKGRFVADDKKTWLKNEAWK